MRADMQNMVNSHEREIIELKNTIEMLNSKVTLMDHILKKTIKAVSILQKENNHDITK